MSYGLFVLRYKILYFVNNAVNVYEKSSNSGMKLNKNYPRLRDTVQQFFNHHEVDSKALVVYFRAEQWKICVEEFCSYVVSCNSRLCMVDKVETCDGRLYPSGSCKGWQHLQCSIPTDVTKIALCRVEVV